MTVTEGTDADCRIARWRATLDTDTLWPGSTAAQRLAAYRRILRATENVLAGRPARLDATGDGETRALGVAAFVSGMGALLAWWIEQNRLSAPAEASRLLAEHLAHSRRRMTRTTEQLREIIVVLARRGVMPAILKGTYTARRYFADPAARPASDVDLLVAPRELEPARDALRELGLVCQTTHDTRPHREEWGLPDHQAVQSVDLAHEANPWVVDLHQSLDRTYFPGLTAGLGSPDLAHQESWPSPFGPARVLTQPLLAAHLALNAGADLPSAQLMKVVELILVLRQDGASGALRWTDLRDLLRHTDTRRFAYPALAMAETLSPAVVEPDLMRDVAGDTTPRMRRSAADALRTLPFHYEGRSIEHYLAFAKGPRQVARRLLDLVYPATSVPRDLLTVWRRRLGLLLRGQVAWRRP